jgi:hypothetical protein
MDVLKIFQGRVVQIAKAPTHVGWAPDLIKDIGARYEFTVIPKPEDLWRADHNKAEFKHGRLGTNIVDFTLFHDGFVVDSATSTDDAELFLDDLMQWFKTRVPTLERSEKPFYLSQLEVSVKLGRFGELLDSIGNQVFQQLVKYELFGVRPYALSTFQLAQDPLGKTGGPNLSPFSIERRLNVPYASNIFFAQAPLRTNDHIFLLQTLEGVLAAIRL